MTKPEIILASASVYRKKLLNRLALPFQVVAADVDETPERNEHPEALVKRLSVSKSKQVAVNHCKQWVIGSDQVAHLDGKILGKPGNQSNALKQLMMCSGKDVQFITGVSLVNLELERYSYQHSVVDARFLDLSERQIIHYLEVDKPFDCAGSFKIEALGVSLFEWVKSSDPTSLEGLPLIVLCQLLRQNGIEIL